MAVHKNYVLDHTKHMFDKIIMNAGYQFVSSTEKPNSLVPHRLDAYYIDHFYQHPTKAKDNIIVRLEQNGRRVWFMHYEQTNGIVAPCYGETKPQLLKALKSDYPNGKVV